MIEIKDLNKTFHLKDSHVEAVKNVSLSVRRGEIYGVIGYSGAGKSTLVRCLNLLEMPDSGDMRIGDTAITFREGAPYKAEKDGLHRMSQSEQNRMRRGIGMIFQHFNLLDRSTVFENVAYPLRYTGMSQAEIRDRVIRMLDLVSLTDKINAYPSQLSGGQKQRVAIARALANNPAILLSDEATSALDPDATESILHLLKELNAQLGLTIILITHEMAVIKSVCHRVAVMENGRVVEEGSVYDIFSQPQAAITRRFVESASSLSKLGQLLSMDSALVRTKPGEKLIRLTFSNDCVGEHIISSVVREHDVDLNIVLANVEVLQDSTLGGMIAILSGEAGSMDAALKYLNDHHVKTEVME